MAQLTRVFVLGDSISVHYGPYLEKAVHGEFTYDRKRGPEGSMDDPVGANGGDSRMVLAYLRERRAKGGVPADWILFNCGLHDLRVNPGQSGHQVTLAEFRQNLGEILDDIEAMKLRPIWMRITPVIDEIHNARTDLFCRYAADVEAYNRIADEVMEDRKVAVIDLHSFSEKWGEGAFIDHVHYDHEVRRKQAEFLAMSLSELRGQSSAVS